MKYMLQMILLRVLVYIIILEENKLLTLIVALIIIMFLFLSCQTIQTVKKGKHPYMFI